MIWQDLVLMLGGFGFSIALIPAVKAREKPPRSSCLMTGSILGIFAVIYATLGLWLAFSSTIITAGMWFALLLQQTKLRHHLIWKIFGPYGGKKWQMKS